MSETSQSTKPCKFSLLLLSMCTFLHVCRYACTYMYMEDQSCRKESSSITLPHSLLGRLAQTQNSLTWLGLLASLLWRSPFPPSEAGITNRLPRPPDIFVGFWGITFQSSLLYCKQLNHQGTSLALKSLS